MQPETFTLQIGLMLALLLIAIGLFASSLVRRDVAAVCLMVALGLSTLVPGFEPLISREALFSGFSSDAVITVIAVMIIGAGMEKTGLMSRMATQIVTRGDRTESRVIPMVAGTAAVMSSFMQNVGTAALFLPVVSRIAARTGIPLSRLLMPMGFCTILGGTATMLGSSTLIMLNDLLRSANTALPDAAQMDGFGLFTVTPVGVALILTGIVYFVLAGRYVLPGERSGDNEASGSRTSRTTDYFRSVYGIEGELREARVTDDSPFVGRTIGHAEDALGDTPKILALFSGDVVKIPPDRDEPVWVNTRLGLMGDPERIEAVCDSCRWELLGEPERFADVLNPQHSGIGEVVIPPSSDLIGKTPTEIKPRRNFGTNILQIYRSEQVIRSGFRDTVLQAGDTLVVHASWKDLHRLTHNRDVVVATDIKFEDWRSHKIHDAILFFTLSLLLYFLTGNLAISLLSGALGMVLRGVITIEEAYGAVRWQIVFLVASLLPFAIALDHTGTSAWLAHALLRLVGDLPGWMLQTLLAGFATLLTLAITNIGATALLVPLAVQLAVQSGADPAMFALTVALSSLNAFLIPTHQVNALVMGPGGYQIADFMRAGGIMSLLFLVVSLVALNLVL